MGAVCEWTYLEDPDEYRTQCGYALCCDVGPKEDGGFKFCPYCGAKIQVKEAGQ